MYIFFLRFALAGVLHLDRGKNLPIYAYLAIILPIMILYNYIRSLKTLAIASTVANVLQMGGMVLIFYIIFKDGLPNILSRDTYKDISKMPLFFGTAIYAFEGIGIVSKNIPTGSKYSCNNKRLLFYCDNILAAKLFLYLFLSFRANFNQKN